MRGVTRAWVIGLALAVLAALPLAAQQKAPAAPMKVQPVAQTPEWQALRTLVGEWEGVMDEGGTKQPASAEIRMTADGSALMHLLGKGTPYEMVTMFHQDGNRLLATHYCAAHNQPRMALVKAAAPNQLAFEFVDGTNLVPGDTHMKRLVITLKDADHHEEAWSAESAGKETPPGLFSFTRKK